MYTRPLPGVLMGGILPFGCIFIQLYFILNSLWYVWCRIKQFNYEEEKGYSLSTSAKSS